MARILIDLSGGPLDGATLDSESDDATDAGDARRIHALTKDQRKGARFARVSPAASQGLPLEHWNAGPPGTPFPAYRYEVTDWLESGDETLIRARFVSVTEGRRST
jgi:hypothetical protein